MHIQKNVRFDPKSNVISGNVAGKTLHCVIRAGAGFPPPGNYQIMPPVKDPIYGMIALLVPMAGQFDEVKTAESKYQNPMAAKHDPVGARAVDYLSPAGSASATLTLVSPERVWVKSGSGGGGQPFVLSAQPMLGRNSLVVVQGFADFIEALESAGGAYVTIG